MTLEQYNNMLNELKYQLMEELKIETGSTITELIHDTIEHFNKLIEATGPHHEARFNDYNDSYSDYIYDIVELLEDAIRLSRNKLNRCLETIEDYNNGLSN